MNKYAQYFCSGFFYFLGLEKNPVGRLYRGIEDDMKNITNDWRNVGKDIKIAYEQEVYK